MVNGPKSINESKKQRLIWQTYRNYETAAYERANEKCLSRSDKDIKREELIAFREMFDELVDAGRAILMEEFEIQAQDVNRIIRKGIWEGW